MNENPMWKTALLIGLAIPVGAMLAACSAGPSPLGSEGDAVKAGHKSSSDAGPSSGTGGSQPGSAGSSSGASGGDAAPHTHVLLFGGQDINNEYLGDTWTWDGTSWTQLKIPGPSPRTLSLGALLGEQVVLFSGEGGSLPLADTWTWNKTQWTQLNVPGPDPRAGAQGGTLGSEFLVYGGYDTGNNLWSWDGSQWTERIAADWRTIPSFPSDIGTPGTIYKGQLLLTDGAQLWTSDGRSMTQFENGAALAGPQYRESALAATLGDTVVMFGGGIVTNNGSNVRLDETWIWNGQKWTQPSIATEPPYDLDPAGMVTVGNSVVLLTGAATNQATPETQMWRWDGVSWTSMHVSGPLPSYRRGSVMVAY